MNRRRLLIGSGISLSGVLAGCLDDGGDDTVRSPSDDDGDTGDDGDDDDSGVTLTDPTSACEAGEAVIRAVAAEEYGIAMEYAPYQYFEEVSREEMRSDLGYDERRSPDEVRAVVCEDEESDEEYEEFLREETGAEVGDAVILEYTVGIAVDRVTYESSVEAVAIELDGDWYAWFMDDLIPSPRATVDVDGSGTESVEVILTGTPSDGVFVQGDGIDDPADYTLEHAGESVTITADEEGFGEYTVVAYVGDSPGESISQMEIEEFSIADLEDLKDAWRDVHEIELEGSSVRWVGVSPEQIEGITNPPLYLVEGREYEITWTNTDGAAHNIELVDENDYVVDDYETEIIAGEGESQTLTFTATPEISQYVCRPHPTMKRGDVKFL